MNPELDLLQPYPFEKLRELLKDIRPADKQRIALSVGEPKHDAPQFVLDALVEGLRGVQQYPSTRGRDDFRNSIASWLCRRFQLTDADTLSQSHILPVNGTREALFAIAQCVLDRHAANNNVLMPNPFYQIYEGATLLAGCRPLFYDISKNADQDINSITNDQLAQSQLIYICNPGNPTGGVLSIEAQQTLIDKAVKHNVIIVSDECYSEIYRENSAAPAGLLQAAHAMGNTDFTNCLVFHSLSKRSNLPGMRSGFIAGDKQLIERFLLYRTYHGCSMPPPVQIASAAAWADEAHVAANRKAYDLKYDAVLPILNQSMSVDKPDAGFYLWPQLPIDDQKFTQLMLQQQNVAVVPGSYLGRQVNNSNPGEQHVRLALVAPQDECVEAAERIQQVLNA